MTLYLPFNGTSNYAQSNASFTFNQVVIVYSMDSTQPQTRYALIGVTGGYFDNSYTSGGKYVYNGTTYTAFSQIPLGTENTVTVNLTNPLTSSLALFSWIGGSKFAKGKIYDVKAYSSGTLVAHYDFSSSSNISGTTITDTSGNGYNATFYGGTPTLVDDSISSGTTYIGSGTSIGTSSATSSEKVIYEASANAQGQSSATSNETLNSPTGTTYTGSGISQGSSSANSTDKVIYSANGHSQGISQANSHDTISLSVSAVSQGHSSATSAETIVGHSTTTYSGSATSQGVSSASSNERMIYEVKGLSQANSSATSSENVRYFVTGISNGQSSATSKETLISVKQIISRVTLQGSRELRIILEGNRELHVILEGNRELHVILKGGTDVPAENQNLTLEAGTDKIIDIPNIVDSTSPLDLTTCLEVHYQAKSGSTVISKDLTNGITVTSPTDLSIALLPADSHGLSGFFKHEVWCVDSNGKKSLLTKGNLIIKPSYADVN